MVVPLLKFIMENPNNKWIILMIPLFEETPHFHFHFTHKRVYPLLLQLQFRITNSQKLTS